MILYYSLQDATTEGNWVKATQEFPKVVLRIVPNLQLTS